MAETTTIGTGPAGTFTLADLERMEQMIRSMPKPPWTLIAPDGRAWQDTDPQALLRVLALAAAMANWPRRVKTPDGEQR